MLTVKSPAVLITVAWGLSLACFTGMVLCKLLCHEDLTLPLC